MDIEARIKKLETELVPDGIETIIVFAGESEIEVITDKDRVKFPRDGMTADDIKEEVEHRFNDKEYRTVYFFNRDAYN